ncbi:MAG: DGQHR domain-containing protein [Muribaculaceae bacterium]|nr:DGQHR domain-containing protein [Muribaculaceae bacterium]
MAFLTQQQRQYILDHMIEEGDEKTLNSKFKARKEAFDNLTIEINELEDHLKDGWEVTARLKTKVKVQRSKEASRRFEHDIWCMFYNLGFKTINRDERLVVQWGSDAGDHKQIDVVAVGKDAIFVVECKATGERKSGNFKKELENIKQYKEGVTKAFTEIYGKDKKVKFIFATRGYTFAENSDDLQRMRDMKVYHFNENSYNYVASLIKAYKTSVIYQFMGLMFKNELISSERIRIPALKGKMGGHDYYMMSIEPATLLKIGFVLHRTKVNDSMAPTYQRLLVPSRLKGITKFIDNGGYFPNSIIVNFDVSNKKMGVLFEPAGKTENTEARFGYLSIPNAYGIAYIIDGQHRVYGYASSDYKDSNTIPVVAFVNMESREQLEIFMDINENQKAVSPSLRLDLAEDINWDSPNLDSRMLALRSSIIKAISHDANGPLFHKISVGEDKAKLTFPPFDKALNGSGLLPKASKKKFIGDTDVCIYEAFNTDHNEAMSNAKKSMTCLINLVYSHLKRNLDDAVYDTYIESNRGTFAVIMLLGSLNSYLVRTCGMPQMLDAKERMARLEPLLNILCEYLDNIPDDDSHNLLMIKGQGAESMWLRTFQNAINNAKPDFQPEGLVEWKQTQDKGLQEQGKQIGEEIESLIKNKVLEKLNELFGDEWQNAVGDVRADCIKRMSDAGDGIDKDWTLYIQPIDSQKIIEKYWLNPKDDDSSFVTFEKEFNIMQVQNKARKDRLKWLADFISMRKAWTTGKNSRLTQADVNKLKKIFNGLSPVEDE